VASCRQALVIKPDYAEAHNNLGLVLQDLGQLESAESSYRRALEIKPDMVEIHLNLCLLLLSQGRYIEAWPEYEARYDPSYSGRQSVPPDLPFTRWQGEPLVGKSIVIWPEQGFGDEIQYARYIPMLKSRGASHITLVCMPSLMALLGTLNWIGKNRKMVPLVGFELTTYRLQGGCSTN
jgi:tetratricopeptide (TPR) repeat protein